MRRLSILVLSFALFIGVAVRAAEPTKPATPDDFSDIVTELNVPVPMRDGVILRANVFRPAAEGKYPVLVWRTPYGKFAEAKGAATYVRAGYIVISQDMRGRYASDGEYESFVVTNPRDGEDGYDTVEWAAKLPQSTGKVGTYGVSYVAYTQWRLGALQPPSLGAMAAFSIPARYRALEGPGTIRPGRRLKWWYGTIGSDLRKKTNGPEPHTPQEAFKLWDAGEGDRLLHAIPWLDLPDSVFGTAAAAESTRAWLRDPMIEPWYLDRDAAKVQVPNLNVSGWYDHCNNSIELHAAIRENGASEAARKYSKLIIGPWNHVNLGKRKLGSVDFGPQAEMKLGELQVRWFDHWLKGIDNGIEQTAPVKIFVMGANVWRDEQEWPLSRAKPQEMFLASAGHANTPAGDGALRTAPAVTGGTDQYRYDPNDPVPTLWDKGLFTMVADQKPLATRQDILVYQSEPLTAPLEVTGYPEVVLYAASSAPTPTFSRLIDVAPDGTALDVCQGMVRARYRNDGQPSELLSPGQVTEFKIRLGPTSIEFQPGHRIRLDITSSDFPNYDRNHNTAADQNADAKLVIADQIIHYGPQHKSRLILPTISISGAGASR